LVKHPLNLFIFAACLKQKLEAMVICIMKNFPPCAQLLNHQVQGLIQGLEEISQQPLVVPSEVEDDARWRQGKGLELGFELEQAHFIFINIILGQ
jgi:hypothetical protein